ncbi:MAG: hypothetical protein ACRDPC_06605 [Solirubrobacteraceae bacterium]
MPFAGSGIEEITVGGGGPAGRTYDVQLPYRRLGRCRVSAAVGAVIGAGPAQVASALSLYEARIGRDATASELLGPGVDLGVEDASAAATSR